MSSHINDQIKKRAKANDVFITPRDLALKQIKLHDIKENDIVLDPCCHNPTTGSYISQFPAGITEEWCEIAEPYNESFFDFTHDFLLIR